MADGLLHQELMHTNDAHFGPQPPFQGVVRLLILEARKSCMPELPLQHTLGASA